MLQYQLKMEDAPILRLLDSIITEGLVSGTSDIHLEPGTEYDRIRYRIDGVLQQVQRLPMERHTALVSCVKLMAGMDIAEKRKPQDGRAQVMHENKKVDLRVSSLPTVLGEKIVIRVLDSDTSRLRLEGMDFTTNNLALFRDMYKSPYGLVVLTGPTGSGKTTTLYATLQELNRPERNIVTIEDPVEYCMEGGQDPNIIMIGEIRDRETAEISIQAALTGHLVFSTLHTNTAAGAVTRLLDMGIEPFLVASALRGIVAQRLVRRLCPDCKKEYTVDESMWEWKLLQNTIDTEKNGDETKRQNNLTLYRPAGCEICRHSGYRGRMAVHEVLPVNTALKDKIIRRVSEQELWEAAKAEYPGLRHAKSESGIHVGTGIGLCVGGATWVL